MPTAGSEYTQKQMYKQLSTITCDLYYRMFLHRWTRLLQSGRHRPR